MKEKRDIYECILSERSRKYYRENVELNAEQKEQIIIHSYFPLERQLDWLRLLEEEALGQDKENVQECVVERCWHYGGVMLILKLAF